nr:integrase, catalytic region, zinc finger, CCHC-type, peptidase aspartic, catalytic [Tanacetum cinerariifolium]
MSLSLAENVIVAMAGNRPPMLDKSNYSSWERLMLLYIKGKEHVKLLVDLVLNRPFQYGTMVEPGNETTPATIRARTYTNLTDEEKIRESVDIKATNIVLQELDSGLVVPSFNPSNNLIANLNKLMTFVSTTFSPRFPQTNNQLRTSSNPRNHATIQDGRVTVQIVQRRKTQWFANNRARNTATNQGVNRQGAVGQARVVKCYNCQEECHFARQCTKLKGPKNSAWFKGKMFLTEALESRAYLDPKKLAFLMDDLDAFDSDCDDVPSAKAVLMASLTSYDSDVLSELFEHGLNKELKEIKVVFNQMEIEVAKCSVDKKYFKIKKKELSLDNDCLLEHIIFQDVMHTIMHAHDHYDNVLHANINSLDHDNSAINLLKHKNDHLMELLISQDLVHTTVISLASIHDYKSMQQSFMDEYNETLVLKVELAKKNNMIKKELLVYVSATCPSTKHVSDKLVIVAPINRTRKVRFVESNDTSKDNIQKQVQPPEKQITNNSMSPSTGVSSSSEPSGSKPSDYLNDVNARVKSKSMKSKSAKSRKKKMWKPTGKVYTDVGYSCKPTGWTFTIDGNTCPLTRIISTNVVPHRKSISITPVKQTQPSSNKSGKLKDNRSSRKSKKIGRTNRTLLAKQGLVQGLPKLKFEKDHLYSACSLGKSKKSSHKPKADDTNQEKLYLLHMDLCGPMRVESINRKKYILAIIDDYSRFTWVNFLRSKNEAPKTEPHFSGSCSDNVDILIAPLHLWSEAVSTACYTPNCSLIRLRYKKTSYELMHEKKPDLSFLYVFGSLCYPTNNSEDLGKLKPKADIVPVDAAPRPVDPTGSPVSTFIDEDVPSTTPPEETAKDKGLAGEVSSSTKKKERTVAITVKDMQKRKNDVKARTTLLLALPDKHQLRFSKYDSAKELWEAILKTFGGNEATKKQRRIS